MIGEQSELAVITKTYDLMLWFLPQIVTIPRVHRFTLGERMENQLCELLELLIEARYTKEKAHLLRKANLTLEKFRFFVRLLKDLHFINLKKYEFLSRQIVDIGSQIGGWLKAKEHGG